MEGAVGGDGAVVGDPPQGGEQGGAVAFAHEPAAVGAGDGDGTQGLGDVGAQEVLLDGVDKAVDAGGGHEVFAAVGAGPVQPAAVAEAVEPDNALGGRGVVGAGGGPLGVGLLVAWAGLCEGHAERPELAGTLAGELEGGPLAADAQGHAVVVGQGQAADALALQFVFAGPLQVNRVAGLEGLVVGVVVVAGLADGGGDLGGVAPELAPAVALVVAGDALGGLNDHHVCGAGGGDVGDPAVDEALGLAALGRADEDDGGLVAGFEHVHWLAHVRGVGELVGDHGAALGLDADDRLRRLADTAAGRGEDGDGGCLE